MLWLDWVNSTGSGKDEDGRNALDFVPLAKWDPYGGLELVSEEAALDVFIVEDDLEPLVWVNRMIKGFDKFVGFPIDSCEKQCIAFFQKLEKVWEKQATGGSLCRIASSTKKVVIYSFEAIEARWRPKGKNGLKVKQHQRPVKGCRELRNLTSLAKCEAAYFIVVLHHLRSVVIAIRGTETAEDLITDGLCKECTLSADDLDGLMNSSDIDPVVKCSVDSSFPHYGHSGIVEAAQDLFMQIDGTAFDHESKSSGYLSSLLGARCECDGYNVRIVGHSLGGSIGALLGIKLYSRYPNLHVYAYGPLPCVDSVVANACSDFVTSTVCNNEFSARLSIGSILRLRAAAITALSQDNKTDTAMISQLARRFLYVSNYQRNRTEVKDPASDFYSGAITAEDFNHHINGGQTQNQNDSQVSEGQHHGFSLWNEADNNDSIIEIDDGEFTNPIATTVNTRDDPISQFMETVPSSENGSAGDPPELYLPGLIIHMVPLQRSSHTSLWKCCTVLEKAQSYKAYIANRENFKDIIVSSSMFLDHLPWRCHYAIQKVLEARGTQAI
ncbi:hypothetical protein CMV_001943 [Castanea mollissima]|uniref:Fungal lipase-type domain-containing protein n=1 Tax=Castanea mollissima TaxID=60419 RepID=A0A8J4VXI8_9ROSI|nr:hypothetical protein CMV_001943 [Castanea mollissima]